MSSAAETLSNRTRYLSHRTAARLRRVSLRGAAIVYLGAFIALPVVVIVEKGFGQGIGALKDAMRIPGAWSAIELTLITAAGATVINAVMGTLIAYILVRYEFRGKGVLAVIVDLPLAIPTLVTGLALRALYQSSSPIGGFLERIGIKVVFAPLGILLALCVVTLPFVIRAVQPVLLELDPAEEEAARTLGASPWTTFRRIVLPALRSSILAGTLLTFARCIGEIGSVIVLSGVIVNKTLTAPVFILQLASQFKTEEAAAVAACLFSLSFILVLVTARLNKRKEVVT
jgi:sulfate transport system permease protein